MLEFSKFHSCGNDFIIINGYKYKIQNPPSLTRKITDRHFGVGADGLILALPSDEADVRMSIFNVDGSEAELSLNAFRCLVKYVYDTGLMRKETLKIATLSGILPATLKIQQGSVIASTINAGKPRTVGENFFVEADGTKTMYKSTIRILGRYLPIYVLSMGNPHCVIFVDDVENFPVEKYGQLIESHPIFPERTNVEFIEIRDKDYLIQRTWERGCGETLSCGTGACAAAVCSHLINNTERKVKVELKGGILEVDYTENDDILTTGPSVKVFDGIWPW